MLYIEIEILHRGTIERIDNVLNHPPMRRGQPLQPSHLLMELQENARVK